MGRIIDETGNRYGRLTVVRRNPENAYHKGANWICRCECGGERVASGIGLRQGLIKSCGCLVRETRVLRCACGYKGQKTRDWTPDWKCYRCSGLSPLQEPPKMTEDELFKKRAEHWRFYHRSAPTSASHDVMLFLERLEKVTKERDMAIEQHRLSQHEVARWVDREAKAVRERDEALARCETLRELADAAAYEQGLAQRRMMDAQRERDEALAIVDVLRGVGCNEDGDGPCGVCRKCAYRHGAEYMREACAEACRPILRSMASRAELAKTIRALPIPEET